MLVEEYEMLTKLVRGQTIRTFEINTNILGQN